MSNETCYKKYRNKLNHILLKAEKQYYHDLPNKHKGNLRKSWGIIKDIIHKNKKSGVNKNLNYLMVNQPVTKRSFQENSTIFLSMLVQRWLQKSLLLTNLYHTCILELMNPYFWDLLLQLNWKKCCWLSYWLEWNKCNISKNSLELYKRSFVSYM